MLVNAIATHKYTHARTYTPSDMCNWISQLITIVLSCTLSLSDNFLM